MNSENAATLLSKSAIRAGLLDTFNRPLHDLRISVIDRCNFRCTYCMPAEAFHEGYTFLNPEEWLTFEELERLVRLFVGLGVSKVRITGGEPLLRKNLEDLIKRLAAIKNIDDLALTTNGALLSRYAQKLKNAGLKRLTVSLDTLNEKIFQEMNGHKGTVSEVLDGIKEAERVGFEPIKINVVVQRGINDHKILDVVRYFKKARHVVRFIEYMDVGNKNDWKPEQVVPSKEVLALINKEFPLRAVKSNYFGEVAERYEFTDGEGEVGFISSITQPFCGTCTRARLSTDGKFYTCLFAGDGHDIKTLLRNGASDQDLLKFLKGIWQAREDRYSEERFTVVPHKKTSSKIEMYQIGG